MTSSKGLRSDIQGLRAAAVLAVVIYHLWPAALPGGYVGVDVFLVISGFLITTDLIRSTPRTWRELGRFWGRRIRRLLPISATVIVTTTIAASFILPPSRMFAAAREAIASAVCLQNWELARSTTNYLTASAEASPFRHFWTLSVEEQFYFVWPILFAGAALVFGMTARREGAARSLIGAIVLVFAASLAYSIYLTYANPEAAYYVT